MKRVNISDSEESFLIIMIFEDSDDEHNMPVLHQKDDKTLYSFQILGKEYYLSVHQEAKKNFGGTLITTYYIRDTFSAADRTFCVYMELNHDEYCFDLVELFYDDITEYSRFISLLRLKYQL